MTVNVVVWSLVTLSVLFGMFAVMLFALNRVLAKHDSTRKGTMFNSKPPSAEELEELDRLKKRTPSYWESAHR